MDDRAVREQVARVEQALEAIEGLPAGPRQTALDALGLVVDLYGEAWARALARVEQAGAGGMTTLTDDELISHLLLIHGLHPEGVEARVVGALAEVRDTVNSDGLDVELVGLNGGRARLRFSGNGHAPVPGLQDLVREAVLGAAPELEQVEIEVPAEQNAGPALVQLRRAGSKSAEGSRRREKA